MNVCSECGQDFAGVRDFDSHRVGVHGYTYWEGLRREPPRLNGRRCLAPQEMIEEGWAQNEFGRWVHPREARRRVVSAPRRVRAARTASGKAAA